MCYVLRVTFLQKLKPEGQGQSKTGPLVTERWRWEIKPTATRWKWTKNTKTKGEAGVFDQGGNKMNRNWPKERNLKHSTHIFTANRKRREPTDGVDSLKTRDHLSRWTAVTLYSLTAASWGRTSQVQPISSDHLWPRSLEIPVHSSYRVTLSSILNHVSTPF